MRGGVARIQVKVARIRCEVARIQVEVARIRCEFARIRGAYTMNVQGPTPNLQKSIHIYNEKS